ncbi:MAG TPA: EF-hand domain-containing protein [Candidatus Binatia bacterium]|nr:EF-hand domain-containing protein [Candidatus Binatia bacterium]
MKRSTRLALLAALGLALRGITAQAQSEPAEGTSGPPRGGPPPAPPRLEQLLQHLLEKYDVNKDGALDQNELAALRKDIEEGKIGPPPGGPGLRGPGGPGPGPLPKEIMDKYDVNKDGKLDETEREALRRDIEAGIVQLPPPGHGHPGPGAPGFRPPTAKEVLDKFDTDKDGKLDETELAAFLEDMQRHRPPPRGPGQGPMGGPPRGGPPAGGPSPQGEPQQH